MRWKLFTILSALSLLLFLAVVGLWIRGYWIVDRLYIRNIELVSLRGWITCSIFDVRRSGVSWDRTSMDNISPQPPPRNLAEWFRKFFPAFDHGTFPGGQHFAVPNWFLVSLTSPAPLLWFILSRRRRPRPGLCQSCGYDLRASTDRCPECGTAIPPKTSAPGA